MLLWGFELLLFEFELLELELLNGLSGKLFELELLCT